MGLPWRSLREAWFGEHAYRLIVINYENLATQPKSTMDKLYHELDEAPFEHDFDNIDYDEPDFDLQLGIPELHKVRPKVEFRKRETCQTTYVSKRNFRSSPPGAQWYGAQKRSLLRLRAFQAETL